MKDWVADAESAALENFSDNGGAIKECLFESWFARGDARDIAGIKGIHCSEDSVTDAEFFTAFFEEPKQFHSFGDDIAPTVDEFKRSAFEESRVHETYLAIPDPAAVFICIVEASVTGRVAVAFDASARDGLCFTN